MKKTGYIFFALMLLIAASCSVTRNIPDNQYVISKVKVEVVGNPLINANKIKRYVQQQQMRKFFGIPIYTYIYNIPNPKKDQIREKHKQKKLQKKDEKVAKRYNKKIVKVQAKRNRYYNLYKKYMNIDTAKANEYYRRYKDYDAKVRELRNQYTIEVAKMKRQQVFTWWEFLRKIGQPPPIYNPAITKKSAQYIKNYLQSLGYYNAKVEIKTKTKNKKIEIKYIVHPGPPLIIDSVAYNVSDSNILNYIEKNKHLRLEPKKILSVKLLQKYRTELVNFLKEHGYYYFSRDYITFAIDTTIKHNRAIVYVNISQPTNRQGRPVPHRRFKIRNVYIFTDYNPNQALANPEQFFSGCDTVVLYRDSLPYYFIKKNSFVIKPKYILKEIYIKPNSLYRFSAVRNTYIHLSKFAIYKLVNIDFKEVSDTLNLLDCYIELTPAPSQSITTEIVGTNSSATIGGALNLTYKHKNLFHGGEIFSLKLHTALESQKFYIGNFSLDSLFNFNTQEYGIDARVMVPRLVLPFSPGEFVEKSNPKTVIQFSYNFQDRPEYNRVDLTYTWSYYWKANIYTNHIFTPSRISSVRVWDMLPEFVQLLEESYLLQSYEDYFIFGTTYSFTYSNQGENRINTVFFQFNFSSSGNLLYELMKLTGQPTYDGSYYMPGTKTFFAQFVKADYDFRVYHNFANSNKLVWRIFMGAGVPLKNSHLLPFGEKYFIGGSNSIRAWQARTLGPGSYRLPENIRYPNQTADIRLETNLEYRYPIIWKLEGAIFLDVGNIWAINKYDNRPGALFKFNEFYKQLAVGTGTGVRLNLNFFVIRLDLGVKLYDPAAPEGYRFIPATRPFGPNDFTINVAIGYPF